MAGLSGVEWFAAQRRLRGLGLGSGLSPGSVGGSAIWPAPRSRRRIACPSGRSMRSPAAYCTPALIQLRENSKATADMGRLLAVGVADALGIAHPDGDAHDLGLTAVEARGADGRLHLHAADVAGLVG